MTGIAVLDLETTGTYFRTDRIVEIGIIHLDAGLNETMRWTSLVNPQRAVTADDIHGIRASDVHAAPTLTDLAEDLMAMLQGRVLVAHNAVFDINHLMLGLQRDGAPVPERLPAVTDTMRLSNRIIGARSLSGACEVLSIDRDDAHQALADADAAAELLRRLVDLDRASLPWATTGFAPSTDTGFWRTAPADLFPGSDPLTAVVETGSQLAWPGLRHGVLSPRPGFTRSHAERAKRHETGCLARLVARLPVVDDDPLSDATPYVTLLDESLEDRLITPAEAETLVGAAEMLGLSQTEVAHAHIEYLTALAAVAWADGVVTDLEKSDLERVARLLGVRPGTVADVFRAAQHLARQRHVTAQRIGAQPGDRVVFTGAMSRPRADLERQAACAGLVPTTSISARTALLVIADPHSQSGKARKARDLGVRLVSEAVFNEVCAGLG
ncbi:MAG: exonuclease domain-containing protein [Candidatus Nanopelagicales bacterium]